MVIIHNSIKALKESTLQLEQLIDCLKELEDSETLSDQITNLKSDIDKAIKDLNEYQKDLEYGDKPHYSELDKQAIVRNDTVAPNAINNGDRYVLTATHLQYMYLENLLTQSEYITMLKFKPLTRKQASKLIEAKKSNRA